MKETPPMPWFGMDIGGSLTKLVYFEPADRIASEEEGDTLRTIRRYLTHNKAYGQHSHRDTHLQMNDVDIGGRLGSLHFIRFPTNEMENFLKLAKDKGMAHMSSTVCATGGGAYKFESVFMDILNMKLHKFDELDSLIKGIQYIEENCPSELFFVDNSDETELIKKAYDSNSVYPFLLVNVGSGVSILLVSGPNKYTRVSGSSLGGGTFLGLCCLLTGCSTFEEAMDLASKGDNKTADKLVKDIYGGDYSKFGLNGEIVASSFGHMCSEEKRRNANKADLARACLVTITNNIGSIARLCARTENIERVLFVGNFLRINPISMKMLSSAMEFWSKGSIKALFCKHEGYFGAIGCLLQLMYGNG